MRKIPSNRIIYVFKILKFNNVMEFKIKVLEFYRIFIEGYIKEDLIVLSSIEPDPISGLKGCTIPTAMTILSSMDLIGFLLNENGKVGESEKNISFFIKYLNYRFFPSYNDLIIEKLINYRHGMMHHFFPKFKGEFAGICKNNESSNLFIKNTFNEMQEESLNVSVLSSDFVRTIDGLKLYLENEACNRLFGTILHHLKNLDYYLNTYPMISCITTINPGTPKN